MINKQTIVALTVGAVMAVAVFSACGKGENSGAVSAKTSEANVSTNENGSVTKAFTECNVTTNGNMVTERRRETRTTTDTAGNVLETSTSEYAQSYTVGDALASPLVPAERKNPSEPAADNSDSFLGLKFGSVFEGTNFVNDADEPTMLRAVFTPAKTLAGFDDYYVYVTPKTHKVVKVYACAKNAVEPGFRWRRHYLIEALEKRYQTWARLASFHRPLYAFDLGNSRYVSACLAGASRDYETVLVGWDESVVKTALDETEEIRDEQRKAAAEKRSRRVSEAADAF